MNEADRAGLLRSLGSVLWDQMRVLADWEEDHGDPWLAQGWRWLADNQKMPTRISAYAAGRKAWCWYPVQSERDVLRSSHVPAEAMRHLPKGDHWYRMVEFLYQGSLDECLLAGARAVGEWLRETAQEEAAFLAAKEKDREARRVALLSRSWFRGADLPKVIIQPRTILMPSDPDAEKIVPPPATSPPTSPPPPDTN